MKMQILKTYLRGKEINGKIIFFEDEIIEEKTIARDDEVVEMIKKCFELRKQYGSKNIESWEYNHIGEDEKGKFTFITTYIR